MNKLIIVLLLFFIFLVSSLTMSTQWGVPGILIYILISSFLVFHLFALGKTIEINFFSFIPIYIFLILSGISAFFNSDLQLLVSSLLIFILYITSFITIPSLRCVNLNEVIYKTIIVSHLIIIVFPYIIYGLDSRPYQGIFDNPNTLGNIVVTLFAVVLALFLYKLETSILGKSIKKYHNFRLVASLSILTFLLYLTFLSGSRTSFLAAIIMIIIGLSYLVLFLLKHKKVVPLILKGSFIAFLTIPLTYLLIRYTPIYDTLYFNIIYKFQEYASTGDSLNGRDYIWLQTSREAGVFGNGSAYFLEVFNLGAHNTFISILGRFGWLPFIFFVLFILVLSIYSIVYSLKKSNDKYKYMPLLLCVCFVTLSMGEVMLFKLSMIAMFFSIGVAATNTNNDIKLTEKC